jgi:ATP-dependent Lon protease
MLTAMVSAFTGVPVRRDLAMTGEITLRGEVLPIGGLKEKALAARRAGITTIVLPSRNERDLAEIPEDLRRDLRFVFVERAEQVLEAALVRARKVRAVAPRRKKATRRKPA